MTTVGYERSAGDVGWASRLRTTLGRLEAEASSVDSGERRFAELLGRCYAKSEVLRLHVLASMANRSEGAPGPESSVSKLIMVRVEQDLLHAALEVLGPGIVTGEKPDWLYDYFWSRAASIYGGTEQIQKGVVARRILKLPGTVEGKGPNRHRLELAAETTEHSKGDARIGQFRAQ
jgi:alkylation response protein AidB-like acyl-CoA dehydrogenase